MDEFSLYVLDIVMNSVRAEAKKIVIRILEEGETLTFSVSDDGHGMSEEQLERLSDPFFTTRKTRKVGLGVPFLRMLSEMTGGSLSITSRQAPAMNHGTDLIATFGRHHIDFLPLGNLTDTLITLIQGAPDTDFDYLHTVDGKEISLSTEEIRAVLGDDVPLSTPEVLDFIRRDLTEQIQS